MSETVFKPEHIDFDRPGKTFYELAVHLDGDWGYVLLPVVVINGKRGNGKGVACFGGTHGNEYEGQVAVRNLALDLDPEEMAGRVILVPRLNPPACEKRMRTSPLDGGNMNRAFPGNPHGTVTFRIADFVTRWIFPRVEVVLDLHSAGDGMEIAPCASFHLVENQEQRREMQQVASLFDLPFLFLYTSEMPGGLLTEEAEQQGKVTIGGEFGHSSGVGWKGVRHAYHGIRNVLRHYGNLSGPVSKIDLERPEPPRQVAATSIQDYIPAPMSGVYEPLFGVGTRVSEAQVVGRLHNFELVDSPPLEVSSPSDGWVMMQPFRVPTAKGATMLVVGKEVQG